MRPARAQAINRLLVLAAFGWMAAAAWVVIA